VTTSSHLTRFRVLIINGHPRAGSFCDAVIDAFATGAREKHEVRVVALRSLEFDFNYRRQELEPAIKESQEAILWADHLVIVYPVWWGTMPALLKAWLDRSLLPGFAFSELECGGWNGLLHGRSATLVATMDTPLWVFRWILGRPSVRALGDATLGFCGIAPVETLLFSPVRDSSAAKRGKWIAEATKRGRTLRHRFRTGLRARCRQWRQALRPQFYVFPWIALTAGAMWAAAGHAESLQVPAYLLACAAAWLLEALSVFTNEIHDEPTDRANENFGPFTGGSRVLISGVVSAEQMRSGRRVVAGALVGCLLALLAIVAPSQRVELGLLAAMGTLLGIGYSAPPLKLASRGLGELTVALTHSALVVLLGYVSQGGSVAETLPWLIIAPMFLSILPSIILAGFPDAKADSLVGKATLVVRFGPRVASGVAAAATMGAAALYGAVRQEIVTPWWSVWGVVFHGAALSAALLFGKGHLRRGRMDGMLILALSYMVWFAIGPLMAAITK
jgi:1,4-dihydroxy-2-naphthoate octaprenyltransferase